MKRILLILLSTFSFLLSTAIAQQIRYTGPALYVPPPAGLPATNLWAYFEGDVVVSIDAGVEVWVDQSGNGRNLMQFGVGRPSYSSPEITINNTTPQFLKIGTAPVTAYTVYAVVSIDNTSNAHIVYMDATASVRQHLISHASSATNVRISSDNNATAISAGTVASNTYALWKGIFNGASSTVQVNSGTATNGNIGSGSQGGDFYLGSDVNSSLGTFKIKALYIYEGSVSDAAVKSYTNTKWGVGLHLPILLLIAFTPVSVKRRRIVTGNFYSKY